MKTLIFAAALALCPALVVAQGAGARLTCTSQQICAVCAATDDSCKALNVCTTDKRVMESYNFAVGKKGQLTALYAGGKAEVQRSEKLKLYYWEWQDKRWQMRFDAKKVRETRSSEFHLNVITYGGGAAGFTNRRRTADVVGFCQLGK